MSKRLGQHFLKNKAIIKKIIDALGLENGDTVVEIGPGNGVLMKEMIERGKKLKVIGIEKDNNLAENLLNSRFVKENNIEIVKGDVLETLPQITEEYKLVGNIPYYITGYLLRILGEMRKKPLFVVFTIQKEVADRLIVKPPKMNILGASVQVWGNIEILSYVSKNDFNPKPKVDSAVIKIIPLKKEIPEKYYETVKSLFKHPRKTILNNLLADSKEKKEVILEKIKRAGLNPKIRPQNLGVEDIIRLSKNN